MFLQQAALQSIKDTELAFHSLITCIKKNCSEVVKQIRDQEETYQDQSTDLQEELELEIAMLMGQEDVMDKLLHTEDNVYFLQVRF